MPPRPTYKGVNVPFWFNEASADAFRDMPMRNDDVILSSMVKAGTTWTNKVVYSILHVYDDDGNIIPGSNAEDRMGASFQVYPDALPLNREEAKTRLLEAEDDFQNKFVLEHFGDFTFEELCDDQNTPRLFSTHLFGMDLLPTEILGTEKEEGKGRLIIVLRNLKDVMCSLHLFRGEPKDGWLGNEHGPGTFHRFTAEDCSNAFGSTFDWILEQEKVTHFLQEQTAKFCNKERVLVVYYEAMKADLPAQIDRINAFLGLAPITDAKRMAIAEACGFSAMKAARRSSITMRKGSIGDWKNHLTKELWEEFDDIFDRKLGNSDLARPLRPFQS